MRSSCVQHVARLVEERSELLDFAGFHHVDGIAVLRSARLRNGTCWVGAAMRWKPSCRPCVSRPLGQRGRNSGMPDDRKKRGGQDRGRINMSENYEVEYWSKTLGVSKERLATAVEKVGDRVEDVRREVGKAAWPVRRTEKLQHWGRSLSCDGVSADSRRGDIDSWKFGGHFFIMK